MTSIIEGLGRLFASSAEWWILFLTPLILGLALTPICREAARRLGMVDKPSARRINKTPIPRSGGIAIFLAFTITLVGYVVIAKVRLSPLCPNDTLLRLTALSAVIVAVGLADDKFGLPPVVKLLGQVAVALGAFFWCGVSFGAMLPWSMPAWLDCALTLFWIVGAVNAFNLIDGLDGLACGLAVIAAVGMGGALFFIGYPQAALVYVMFAGACIGFLRYNFNPASVFLGDSGSMYIGFMLATLPLLTKAVDSLFVGIGVPLLAMGVPIFDTSLAILRRTVRAILKIEEKGADEGNSNVMQADTDHLHHRILRKYVSQRKAAYMLYALAAGCVLVGLGGLALRDRAAALFSVAFVLAVAVIVRDMRRIELWDVSRLLNLVAHDGDFISRRRRLVGAVSYHVVMDVIALVGVFFLVHLAYGLNIGSHALHTALPLRVVPVFVMLLVCKAYTTVWGRAPLSSYMRLAFACLCGTVTGSAAIVLLNYPHRQLALTSILFFSLSVLALVSIRLVRPVLRDLFYHLDHGRLVESGEASRIVVYGAGLRYAMFRRELVRSSSRNTRVIVGLLDDNSAMHGLYIGGMRILGGLDKAAEVIRDLRADAVVVACEMPPERLEHVREVFAAAGAKVSLWSCEERAL